MSDQMINARIIDGVIQLREEITPLQIAEALARVGGTFIPPTDEQAAIIGSRHWGPAVVIAGAGSGKTETMTQRVLWLVANGVVAPSEILGLTFTRKAAGELTSRIQKRLRQLRKANMLPSDAYGPLEIAVDISTYHSYAGRVLSQHGIRLGIDAEIEPLGEAAAWQLFSEIVAEFPSTLHPIDKSPNTVVDAISSLSSQIAEHNRTPQEVRDATEALLEKFATIDLAKKNVDVTKAISVAQERLSILPMVEIADKKRRDEALLTFDDHMNLAATLVSSIADVALAERAKYKVVLLDEYQDTSASQIRFLSALFKSSPGDPFAITAVGDPQQAIYGWRGASADTLQRFAQDFLVDLDTSHCEKFTLLTSWRNDRVILDFANQIIDQISVRSTAQGRVRQVDRLTLSKKAGVGELVAGRYLTAREEALAIAERFEKLWNDPARINQPEADQSSFAVLIRAKSYIPEIEAALLEKNLPVEVVGLGGLIHVPEVAEIIALLRALTFPDAGTSLARLLVGPRLALGPRDLMALGRYARKITEGSKEGKSRRLEEILESGEIISLENDDFAIGSIIEALDQIADAPRENFSPVGYVRLVEFATELAALRRQLHGSITDILVEAERFLRLDTELLVRSGWETGRRHLDSFMDEAAHFQRNGGTLPTFLNWLDVADKREGGLKPASITVSNRAIQILTIHGAKGGEWDHIAIPGLVKGNFPSEGKKSESWLKNSGSIPLDLRADADQFGFSYEFPATTSTPDRAPKASEVATSLKNFDESWKALRLEEEFRLAYVAFTRARHSVIATASIYRDGTREKGISQIYQWVKEHLLATNPDAILEDAEDKVGVNPVIANPRTGQWPAPSSKLANIQASAQLVDSSQPIDLTTEAESENLDLQKNLNDARMIIEEIARRRVGQPIYLPDRLSVSTLVALKSDPEQLALSIRRPMPNPSNPFAQRGTQFHEWLERYFEISTLFDDSFFDPATPLDLPLKELQDKWLASEWAPRRPIAVEMGFETTLDGTVLKGRIDAIYKGADGRYEVIDWKTGRAKSGDELAEAAIQLAVYRLAFAKLHNLPVEDVSAGFFYVNENLTIRPTEMMGESELRALLQSIERAG